MEKFGIMKELSILEKSYKKENSKTSILRKGKQILHSNPNLFSKIQISDYL